MKRLFVALSLMAALGGCAVKEHMRQRDAARDDAACQSYGALPGSDAYIACRAQLGSGRKAAAGAFMGGVIQNQPQTLPAQASPPMLCNWVGNTVSCH